MKTIILSDLHGNLIDIKEKFDLLLICGDVAPYPSISDLTTPNGLMPENLWQWNWLNNEFVNWINSLPYNDFYSKVVMIAGNHEYALEGLTYRVKTRNEWTSKMDKFVYLDNEEYDFLDKEGERLIKIFGCPYCKVYGNWAFMRENLDRYYDFIPKDIDILMTHDAADIDGLGTINEGRNKGRNAGNKILAKYVSKVKPKYYFCGHIHTGRHELKNINGVKSANVSICDETNAVKYNPLIIDF